MLYDVCSSLDYLNSDHAHASMADTPYAGMTSWHAHMESATILHAVLITAYRAPWTTQYAHRIIAWPFRFSQYLNQFMLIVRYLFRFCLFKSAYIYWQVAHWICLHLWRNIHQIFFNMIHFTRTGYSHCTFIYK